MNSKNIFRKTISLILFVSAIALTSCSDKICSAYARSEDRVYNVQLSRNRTSIPSPFNTAYKAELQKKYTGRK